MYYLVIDLEMCGVPKMSRRNGYSLYKEIIQIGAVMLDEDYAEVDRLSILVRPQFGNIDKFIERLTGIKYRDVKNAPMIAEAVDSLIEWIGERECRAVQWSSSDLTQLSQELNAKNISSEAIEKFLDPERWEDYQQKFDDRFGYTSSTSLEQALILCNIDTEGRMHDGLADAANTAALIRFLEHNPDYKIKNLLDEYSSDEPCTYSLGSIFSKLNL